MGWLARRRERRAHDDRDPRCVHWWGDRGGYDPDEPWCGECAAARLREEAFLDYARADVALSAYDGPPLLGPGGGPEADAWRAANAPLLEFWRPDEAQAAERLRHHVAAGDVHVYQPAHADERLLGALRQRGATGLAEDLARGFRDAGESMRLFGASVTRVTDVLRVGLEELANEERRVCGLEARFYVRGAMADTHHHDSLAGMVHVLLREPWLFSVGATEEARDRALTPASRGRIAAAAVAGYVAHHPEDAPEYRMVYRCEGDGWWPCGWSTDSYALIDEHERTPGHTVYGHMEPVR